MLCENFAESWFNGEHRLIRRTLRPFCLWHYAYLQFIESPLIQGGKGNPDWPDLELASRICQLQYEQQLPSRQSVVQRLATKANLFVAMASTTLSAEISAFHAYMADYFASPQFNSWKSKTKGPKRGNPPDVLAVASSCIALGVGNGKPGGAEKYVWEMPIGQAYWYSSAYHYNNGAPLDYMTARDEAFRKFLRKQKAEGKI